MTRFYCKSLQNSSKQSINPKQRHEEQIIYKIVFSFYFPSSPHYSPLPVPYYSLHTRLIQNLIGLIEILFVLINYVLNKSTSVLSIDSANEDGFLQILSDSLSDRSLVKEFGLEDMN